MINIDNSNYELVESDEVFTFKNENTTLGFVRFNDKGEVEYIFVNPIFRKQGFANPCFLKIGLTNIYSTSPLSLKRTNPSVVFSFLKVKTSSDSTSS